MIGRVFQIKYKEDPFFQALVGMIMPIIVQFEFEDGSKEIQRIPAEIWMLNQKEVTKIII